MLVFKKLTLEDMPTVRSYFSSVRNRFSDYTIGGTFMWRGYFETEFAVLNGSLVFKVRYIDGEIAFSCLSCVKIEHSLAEIDKYCAKNDIAIAYCSVAANEVEVLKNHYENVRVKPERDWFDYLYNSEDLRTLRGKKYNGQRNHINRFKRQYPNHAFEKITDENIGDVRRFYESYASAYDKDSHIAMQESKMVFEVLDNYNFYKQIGGALYVEGEVVGFSIGEVCGDTLFVHIEKADTSFHGSYQMLVNNFASMFAGPEVDYINREEDVGDPGLRTAKLAYHPCCLLEKYTVKVDA